MNKAIDEMRAYFNQPPVPPAGALLEFRKKVNRWLDEAEAENAKLRELGTRMARVLNVGGDWCERDCSAEFGCTDNCPIADAMRELGMDVNSE